MNSNPIRKRRTLHFRNPHGSDVKISGGWYAFCFLCDKPLTGYITTSWAWNSTLAKTRKQAKDALHRHVMRGHK